MKKILTFLFTIIAIAGYSQSITVTVGGVSVTSVENADSLGGKAPSFYVDTLSAAFQPENVIYVTQESDFGTPSGGAITLANNTVYILYNDDPATSRKVITLTNRLIMPDSGGVRITGVGIATLILSYT
ncbi:MAG: hypothetical protein ACUZ8E_09650, partial [Candidatus Anammoxibacter sp.]